MSGGLVRSRLAPALLLFAFVACGSAGSGLSTGVTVRRNVRVGVFLDRDASATLTGFDTVYAGARVALLPRIGGDTIRAVLSDDKGVATFAAVEPGEYRLAVTQGSIGDSLLVMEIVDTNLRVEAGLPDPEAIIRLGYPELTIAEARALTQGRRVVVKGIVTVTPFTFRDTTAHLRDASGHLRLTNATRRGSTPSNPGDTVTVLGTTGLRAGQPVLEEALIAILAPRTPPTGIAVTTGAASTAAVGTLDAALVQVNPAVVTDTATIGSDFRVLATDGTGELTILLDGRPGFVTAEFYPGRSLDVVGVLVPDGLGSWRLKPRNPADIVFNN